MRRPVGCLDRPDLPCAQAPKLEGWNISGAWLGSLGSLPCFRCWHNGVCLPAVGINYHQMLCTASVTARRRFRPYEWLKTTGKLWDTDAARIYECWCGCV